MSVLVAESCQLFVTPWIGVRQTPLSMRFPRIEYLSGLPFHSPGYLPNPGIEPRSPALQADSLPHEPLGKIKPRQIVEREGDVGASWLLEFFFNFILFLNFT